MSLELLFSVTHQYLIGPGIYLHSQQTSCLLFLCSQLQLQSQKTQGVCVADFATLSIVIPVLGAQRLMGPKVVRFLSEKFVSLLPPTILLRRKRLIIRNINGNVRQLWSNFQELHTETPWQKYTRRAKDPRQKKIKKSCSIQMQI